ncbi:MAG: PepSY domain-containing protein, partial [Pseudomonadota bacterium]
MVSIDPTSAQADAARASDKLYFAAWRWHFYAGLYVIPFFTMLAVTGLFMLWIAFLAGRDGERYPVVPKGASLPISQQAEAAVAALPGGELKQYLAPRAPDLAAVFRVDLEGEATMIAVDPYTATVLAEYPRRSGLYDLMDNIHGSLLLGVTGDRMIEIAASLGMV